jgi:hypothetical protein
LSSCRENGTSSSVKSDGYPLSEKVIAISPKKRKINRDIKIRIFFKTIIIGSMMFFYNNKVIVK